jgi:hypothetical protein
VKTTFSAWYDSLVSGKNFHEKIGHGELPFFQAISPSGKAGFRKYENFLLGM